MTLADGTLVRTYLLAHAAPTGARPHASTPARASQAPVRGRGAACALFAVSKAAASVGSYTQRMAKPGLALLLRDAVLGLFAYGLACLGALLLAFPCVRWVGSLLRPSNAIFVPLGVTIAGIFAGALAELVGVIGNVQPPWRRRWTLGAAVTTCLFAAWWAIAFLRLLENLGRFDRRF